MDDHTVGPLLDLSHVGRDVIAIVLGYIPLRERFICALVCKTWAEAARAATHSIILRHKMQDFSGLQHWLENHGIMLEVLQLHACCNNLALTALPCCAKLQDLLLHGASNQHVSIASRTWSDIASATKLTSISLKFVHTASQQADVVAALTALPNLEQLTWCGVQCNWNEELPDSFQCLARLTSLDLQYVTAVPLPDLGSLTNLQHLSISVGKAWPAAGCPGLQELKALTSLKLDSSERVNLPASVSQLTALRQLDVCRATPTALNRLHALTGLTQLRVRKVAGMSAESPPLQLAALQHLELELGSWQQVTMPMSFLASCKQLQFLELRSWALKGPGSLVASTVLQHLELHRCSISAADGAADPVSWQQVLLGPGQLPHLTSLRLLSEQPQLQQADIEGVAACCSNLMALGCDTLQSSLAPALARLPGLTSLQLHRANDDDCNTMVQLTALRQLELTDLCQVSAVGLRHLAALTQLTSLGFGIFCRSPLSSLVLHLMWDKLPGYFGLINKAPSGSPSDVSSRLLVICNVVDACEGLDFDAVTAAAYRLMHPGSTGPSGDGPRKFLTAEALLAAAAALRPQGD